MSLALNPKILPDPAGFETPPRQNSPKAVQGVDRKLVVWLQNVQFFAESGSVDDLSRIAELAKRIPESTSPAVKSEILAVANGEVFDCSDLVETVKKAILAMGIRVRAPDNMVMRAMSPLFFSSYSKM